MDCKNFEILENLNRTVRTFKFQKYSLTKMHLFNSRYPRYFFIINLNLLSICGSKQRQTPKLLTYLKCDYSLYN